MSSKNTHEGLSRSIGIRGLAATTINNTIGAGIFVIPAIVSMQMGAEGILGYLFCGAILIAIILCYIEIGSKFNTSGGSYIYVETTFGPYVGFLVNCLFVFGWGILGSAAVMNIVADSLSILFPSFSNPFIRAILYFILLGAMVWVNVRGVKQSVHVLELLTIIKLIPLFGIIIFGISEVKMSNLHWEHWPSFKTLGETSLVLFFAFAGFETSLGSSGEIKDPKRTLPIGILSGVAIVYISYILIQIITQGVLGAQITEFKDAPLAEIARNIIGPIGAVIILVATIISCLGNTGGDVLATPRLLFAGAEDGLFPRFLAKIHSRFATPYLAVITYASLIFIVAISGGFKHLAILASGALLLIYLTVILAMIKLRLKKEPSTDKSFKVPGGLVVPIIAIAAIIWLLTHLKVKEILSTIILLLIISVIYFFMNKNRMGIFKNPIKK